MGRDFAAPKKFRVRVRLPNPFAGPSCPPSSPEPTSSLPVQPQPGTMFGKKTPELESRLNGDVPYPPGGIRAPIGKRYAAVPKEETSNLFRQMCTFDIIVHSEELAQILYNLFSERLSSKSFGGQLDLVYLTNLGKSHAAWQEAGNNAYSKDPLTKWWDGYSNQTNVIIDEFRGIIQVAHLLRWFDKYPVSVEKKGGKIPLFATNFWITSNLSPASWYPELDAESYRALERRLIITHFNKPFGS
jgi:hypothetical protein